MFEEVCLEKEEGGVGGGCKVHVTWVGEGREAEESKGVIIVGF